MNESEKLINRHQELWMPHDQFKDLESIKGQFNNGFNWKKKKRKRKPVYSAKAPKHDQSSTN